MASDESDEAGAPRMDMRMAASFVRPRPKVTVHVPAAKSFVKPRGRRRSMDANAEAAMAMSAAAASRASAAGGAEPPSGRRRSLDMSSRPPACRRRSCDATSGAGGTMPGGRRRSLDVGSIPSFRRNKRPSKRVSRIRGAAQLKRMSRAAGADDEAGADDDRYTSDDAIRRRRALRHHPLVIDALAAWWDVAMRCRGARDDAPTAGGSGDGATDCAAPPGGSGSGTIRRAQADPPMRERRGSCIEDDVALGELDYKAISKRAYKARVRPTAAATRTLGARARISRVAGARRGMGRRGRRGDRR